MRYLISLLGFFVVPLICCYGQGLIFDENEFNIRPELEKDRSDFVPANASIKRFSPYVLTQENSTCVAYSVSSARAMLYARDNNILDEDIITSNLFSPHWIYFRNKENSDVSCSLGLSIDKVMSDVLNVGMVKMALVEYPDYYPFTNTVLCNYYPPSYYEDLKDAYRWRVDKVYKLTDLEGIKLAISQQMPVIVGMLIPSSFNSGIKTELWTPTSNDAIENAFGHAMVIVSYDDNKFGGSCEILNSWGAEWGNKGFIWVKYNDLVRFTLGAYALNNTVKFGSEIKLEGSTEEKEYELLLDKQITSKLVLDSVGINKFMKLKSKFKETVN